MNNETKSKDYRNKKNFKKGSKSRTKDSKNNKDFAGSKPYDSKGETHFEEIHSNNIEWWNRSPIYMDSTNIQNTRFPGYTYWRRLTLDPDGDYADPAIICYNYIPVIGVSTDYNSPVNRSFTSLYAQIVAHTNSSNLGFTQSSLAMLAMSAASVVGLFAEAKRAIGLRGLYINENANFPRVLYKAAGFDDYETVNWEKARVKLNTLIQDFNSLNIPKYVSLYDRYFQLPYNIYADEDSVTAQLYLFKPSVYYMYEDINNRAKAVKAEYTTLDGLLDTIKNVLIALRSTSDLGLIMGAYRRAFPEHDTIKFDLVGADFVVVPYHDRNMTWQINNMSMVGDAVDIGSLDITEDVVKDILYCQPTVLSGEDNSANWSSLSNIPAGWATDEFIPLSLRMNSYDGNMSNEFVMEATRLMFNVVTTSDGSSKTFKVKSCGTELVSGATCYYLDCSTGEFTIVPAPLPGIVNPESDDSLDTLITTYSAFAYPLWMYTKFKNAHPMFVSIPNGDTADSVHKLLDLRDYNVTTTLDGEQLDQIHEAALQSCYLLNVPTRW